MDDLFGGQARKRAVRHRREDGDADAPRRGPGREAGNELHPFDALANLGGRLVDAGGTRVAARNPYWDQWGVTIADPDGYRLVLSNRSWP